MKRRSNPWSKLSAHKLPAERVLAQRLNFSRTTVREAIRVLETEGYVERQRGAAGGLVVVARHEPRTQLKQRLKDEWIRFEEILEFWLANERAAASLATTRRTEEDLGRLADTLQAIRSSESLSQFRRTDSRFGSPPGHCRRGSQFYVASGRRGWSHGHVPTDRCPRYQGSTWKCARRPPSDPRGDRSIRSAGRRRGYGCSHRNGSTRPTRKASDIREG